MKSTKTVTINEAAQILPRYDSFALFAHTRPDGDTVGATVALCLALRSLGKTVAMFCDSPMPQDLQKFSLVGEFSTVFSGKYQLAVAVDCGDIFRIGELSGVYDSFAESLTVDHHGNEQFSKYYCFKKYASTCQMVYEILLAMHVNIDSQIATYLYMGLCTDTGNFSNSNTDAASFRMAADLCELGADFNKINRVFFQDTTLAATKLWGRALSRVRSYYNDKLVLVYITAKDLADYNLDATVSEGIVNKTIAVETAQAGVSLCEYAPNSFKVSMRGKNGYNVREVCQHFGGNGHLVAAGCMINGFLEDVIDKIVRVFGYEMEQ